ncbi:MAG: DNA helicase RecQ [Flavobacteriales bacterium]|nr:DNA helicase RecQ [Flavobacteriales bacterium]
MSTLIKESLNEELKRFFGFDNFKGKQEQIIQNLLEGNDTFVIMPTGGGKSLCYQLPALMMTGTAIIVSPLIALMKNQVDAIRNYSSDEKIAHFLNSSLNKSDANRVKQDVKTGQTKLLYVAPESLTKQENIDFLKSIKISLVAVDEAHCISEWGHDFRPEYRRIKEMVNSISQKIPLIALTATATPKVQSDIQKNLGMNDAKVFKDSFNRSNLYYGIQPKTNVAKEIIKFIKSNPNKSGIVYCLSRKKVEEIAELLQVNGIKALPYHAGMDANTRAANQDKFLMEDVDVIVATIAFGMGIDKPDVRFVIHHDIPKSIESYYQETGRAGRDGGEGVCLTFYRYKDIEKLEKFLSGKPINEQEIGRQLLLEMISYAETSSCRRQFILKYFGEEYNQENCSQNCDNCKYPREQFEAKEQVLVLLNVILELNNKFKTKYIINYLLGKFTTGIESYGHQKNDSFGVGKEHDDKFWSAIIRQCWVAGFIQKEIENYGILKLTKKGKKFIESPYSFELAKDREYPDADDESIVTNVRSSDVSTDENLFKMLKDLTKNIAKEKGLPPYVIFQEPSLHDMATQYPICSEELTNIVGVGQGKAAKFGKPFLELIKKYVEDNNIERPLDMVVKSVVNKSGQKVFIIQCIDRKMPLEDIGKAKGLQLGEVITQLENIVESGTKVNLEYYLNDLLDPDYQQEIIDYFLESETDCVQEAIEEFGADTYSEEEIRLVRIKFLSEFAN